MSDLEQGLIQFHQACLPSLFPGDYTIRVHQTIQEIRPNEPFETSLDFFVAGPRFSLNPGDVYSVYPPADQAGRFAETLPQIVFTRRSLPWERTLDGRDPDEKHPCSWLALLVLSGADFAGKPLPAIQTLNVGSLLEPEGDCLGPSLSLKAYESPGDACNTIDLPANKFVDLVPRKEDLPYLAHVREVSTENKETLSYQSEGSFAVVLANRFPKRASRNLVCLVSLEGFQEYIDLQDGQPGNRKEIGKASVRLAVLASWMFFCEGKEGEEQESSFKVLINDLDTGALKRPFPEASADSKAAGEDTGAALVREAFELGYTALNHHIRNGEKTVSWYRGPLAPLTYFKAETYPFLPSADAALRYNYETGLLDVSYAAAWQLGRMLALQNHHFAQALYRYRNQGRLKTKVAIRKDPTSDSLKEKVLQVLKSGLDRKEAPEGEGRPRKALIGEEKEEPLPAEDGGSPSRQDTREFVAEFDLILTGDTLPIPEDIGQWLGRALLLYGVPFNYLVPDEPMLPSGSIRFFSLDPFWIKCLLEGACSVGRTGTVDTVLDEHLRNIFLDLAGKKAREVRTEDRGNGDGRLHWPLTGFLLRSPIVEGWQGLEMRAVGLDANGRIMDPLEPLRIDRLGPEIMICIFNGKVTEIEIKQPPEGLHFGASFAGGNSYEKITLRRLWPAEQSGTQLPDSTVDIPMRRGVDRVIEIQALAARMRERLNRKNDQAIDGTDHGVVTSAEFAVQMVESPGKAIFRPKNYERK